MRNIGQELAGLSPGGDCILTVGVFDGLHLGHRHLLSRLRETAAQSGKLSGVLTFLNFPESILSPNCKKKRYLSTVDDRINLIRQTEVDFICPLTFDLELSKMRAAVFLDMLCESVGMSGLLVGADFALGHEREADVEKLIFLGSKRGVKVTVVDDILSDDGQPIRSTVIREALCSGDVLKAGALLGRNFKITGTVVHGNGRGYQMGYPTANIQVFPDVVIPSDGIYATWSYIGSRRYMSATSIGTRPTFNESGRTVETFVMAFDGDLYGKFISLEFVSRLRAEVKFDSQGELQAQIGRDVTRAALELRASRS